jgi:hypothetical protein
VVPVEVDSIALMTWLIAELGVATDWFCLIA